MKRKALLIAGTAGTLFVFLILGGLKGGGTGKAHAAVTHGKLEIVVDGERIDGLKGFTYEIYREGTVRGVTQREGILHVEAVEGEEGLILLIYGRRPGLAARFFGEEPGGAVYGRLHVKGKIIVACPSVVNDEADSVQKLSPRAFALHAIREGPSILNKHMDNNTSFQIILSGLGSASDPGLGGGRGRIASFLLEGCIIEKAEMEIGPRGTPILTYTFTADRIREA